MFTPMSQCKFKKSCNQLTNSILISEVKTSELNELDESVFNMMIRSALKSTHGDKGLAATVDILKFDSVTSGSVVGSTITARAYLRISADYLVIVRSSLTLLSNYEGDNCSIKFNKVCHSLSSLPLESRNCNYNIVDCFK